MADTVRAEDVAAPVAVDLVHAAETAVLASSSSSSAGAAAAVTQSMPASISCSPRLDPPVDLDLDLDAAALPAHALNNTADAPPALVELEPLPDGAAHALARTDLGARPDGTHVDVVRDARGHFFRRVVHSAFSSAAAAKTKRPKQRRGAPEQVTYGLGHSRGAPVVVRVPHQPPVYTGAASAPVSRMASRIQQQHSHTGTDAPGGLQPSLSLQGGSGTQTPLGGRSAHHHHHHHRHHQHRQAAAAAPTAVHPLIGLAHANPLSGMLGSANPNRAPAPSSRGAQLSTADVSGAGAGGVNAELLVALREIIREEVRSARGEGAGAAVGREGKASSDSHHTAVPPDAAAPHEHARGEDVVIQDGVPAERGPGFGRASTHAGDKKAAATAEDEKKALSSSPARPSSKRSHASTDGSLYSHSTTSSSSDDELDFPNPWSRARYALREPFAEFLGTCILIIFGNGINCQVFVSQLFQPDTPRGDYLSVSFGWGIGTAFAIYVSGGVSGGHLNPGITIALACFRGFPWRKVPVYALAQILGGAMGALLIYGLYSNPIRVVDPGQTETTAALFTTFPAEFLRQPSTRPTAFYNEVLATAVLMIIVLAIGDAANTPPPDGLAPLVLMWAIVGIGATMGWQTAYCLNIARDLGPRIALAIVGYPADLLWSFNAYYFLWTPILATITGALVGAFIYDTLMYTGGESPLNVRWRWSGVGWRRQSKRKLPAGISA